MQADVKNIIADTEEQISKWQTTALIHIIVTGKQIGRASCRERVSTPV